MGSSSDDLAKLLRLTADWCFAECRPYLQQLEQGDSLKALAVKLESPLPLTEVISCITFLTDEAESESANRRFVCFLMLSGLVLDLYRAAPNDVRPSTVIDSLLLAFSELFKRGKVALADKVARLGFIICDDTVEASLELHVLTCCAIAADRLGRIEDALFHRRQVVSITEKHVAEGRATGLDVSKAQCALATTLVIAERVPEAAEILAHTVEFLRDLASSTPFSQEVARALAQALAVYGPCLRKQKRLDEARTALEEAWRLMVLPNGEPAYEADKNYDSGLPEITIVLNNLGLVLEDLTFPSDAVAVYAEAIRLRRSRSDSTSQSTEALANVTAVRLKVEQNQLVIDEW